MGGRREFMAARALQHRLYTARDAPLAVVLTRRAGGWSRLALLDLDHERISVGSWLHARVFPPRCDLSPDGRLFGFFAHDGRGDAAGQVMGGRAAPGWTAVSRPPELTALAWWGEGTTWTMGPFFPDSRSLWTGYHDGPDRGTLPRWLRYPVPLPHPHPGPEFTDRTVPLNRLRRDGWAPTAADEAGDTWARPLAADGWLLEVQRPGAAWMERQWPRWLLRSPDGDIVQPNGVPEAPYGLDIDHGGGLVAVTFDATVLRWREPHDAAEVLGRLPDDAPAPRVPPSWAQKWPSAP